MKTIVTFLILFGVSIQAVSESTYTNAYLPVVRVSPNYPEMARERDIEGFCSVLFTVTKEGNVEDPKILECENQQYFESAVIEAISRFKYVPKKIEGRPVSVEGMIEIFWFSEPKLSKHSHYKNLGIANIVGSCSAAERKCEAHLGNP